ncbi:hypothetical protein AO368_1254 [Moraxella catarrhalis]|nr:hypothetical protein AO368_1254 [Moraxella catarrhalis]
MIIGLKRPILAEILSLFEYFNVRKYLKISKKNAAKNNQPTAPYSIKFSSLWHKF